MFPPFLIMAGDKAVLPVTQAPSPAIVWAGIWLSCDYGNLNASSFLTSLSANPSQNCPQVNLSSRHPIFTLRYLQVSFCYPWEIQSYPAPTHGLQKVILQLGLPFTLLLPHWYISLRHWTSALALWAQPGQLPPFCLSFPCQGAISFLLPASFSASFSLPRCHHSWFTFPTTTCILSSIGPRAWERHLANNHNMTSSSAFRALTLIILCHKA